ncbi:MAG: NAD-dependent epimerase/dehydratase family protein [Desulfovibrio sp.]|jgi:UDP-glucose 4-epimerase|nr:NAD-dependent epimerase/dehydratase family protein [Desulfovibrio sp.]
MITGKRICITGGAGFIGSVLCGTLCEYNTIIVLDNLFRNTLQQYTYANHKNISLYTADILDVEDISDPLSEADYIIHCAGITGIQTVGKSPTRTMHVNITGSINVLELARQFRKVKRILTFSTSEVFGSQAFGSRESDDAIIATASHPRWTYAVSKLAEEHLTRAYYLEFGLPATVVRPFNIYGPCQVGEGAMKIFIQQALRNEPITIYGDGTQIRAWCYVDDMVDAVLCCLENDAAVGESFNIGNARSVQTIYGLANVVIRVLNSKSPIIFAPALSADIEMRIPCVTKAKDVLGFEAKVDLEEGIRRTAEFYLKRGNV